MRDWLSGNGVILVVDEGSGQVLPAGYDETWVKEMNKILEVLTIHSRKRQTVTSNVINECVVQFLLTGISRCVFLLRLGVCHGKLFTGFTNNTILQ